VKILMFGRGTIASIYGWALEQAGHVVEFYVRPGRAAEYGDSVELDLLDARHAPLGRRIAMTAHFRYRETLTADDAYDLVVLSVSHERLADAVEFLAPRLGDATLLVLGNVWPRPPATIDAVPEGRVVWGFPLAGGGFGDDGTLHGGMMRGILFGAPDGPLSRREREARAAFARAGFAIREQGDMHGWLAIHFVADAGMHAQGLRLGSLSKLIGDRRGLREAILTSRELLPVLAASGVELRRHRGSTLLYRAPSWLTASLMSVLVTHVGIARASLAAHTDPNAREPRAVVDDALAEAHRLGIPTPRLESAARVRGPRTAPEP
jgi:2-dehydropantoate 2-reductase